MNTTTTTTTRRVYIAGALFHPGTNLASNVTGDCPHRHTTPEAAQQCIERRNRQLAKIGAYCDRVVIECDTNGRSRTIWNGDAA
jgi:hypothetical protein